jgi:acid phosphatase
MRFHQPLARAALSLAGGILFSLVACTTAAVNASAPSPVVPTAQPSTAGNLTGDDEGFRRLKHIVVIYMENHSFDNLYGEFPGANGLANAGAQATQVDLQGKPFAVLPTLPGGAFPSNLPNAPFNIEQYIPIGVNSPDLVHRFYQEQEQIDRGKMDKFAAISDARGLVMGYYHTANLSLAAEAKSNTLCDNFFHGAFGGSFLNHIYFISAQVPTFASAPQTMRAQLDRNGALVRDGAVTPDPNS